MSFWSKLFGTLSDMPVVRSRLGLVRLDDRSLPSVTLPDGTVWVAPMLLPEQPATIAPPADPTPAAGRDGLAAPINNADEKKDEPKKDDQSTGSEITPDPKTHPPSSTGKDRTPEKGDAEDMRAADREKAGGDVFAGRLPN